MVKRGKAWKTRTLKWAGLVQWLSMDVFQTMMQSGK
jgi:hypothetical protein